MAVFLDEALHQLEADAGNILLLNTPTNTRTISRRGFRHQDPYMKPGRLTVLPSGVSPEKRCSLLSVVSACLIADYFERPC